VVSLAIPEVAIPKYHPNLYYYVGVGGLIPSWFIFVSIYYFRITYMLPGFPLLRQELRNIPKYLNQLTQVSRPQERIEFHMIEDVMAVKPENVISRCRFPFELVLACDALLVTSRAAMPEKVTDILTKGTRRFRNSVTIQYYQIVIAACHEESTARNRSQVQAMIRKLVGRNLVGYPIRSVFYTIIKVLSFTPMGYRTR
jgi:hypothetical protein